MEHTTFALHYVEPLVQTHNEAVTRPSGLAFPICTLARYWVNDSF